MSPWCIRHDAGQAGEYTGSTRPWRFGDEQAIDAATTVRNALFRQAEPVRLDPAAERRARVRLAVEDFEVAETERRASAAVCLLVDLSYSMALRGTWGAAKQTALALHALVHLADVASGRETVLRLVYDLLPVFVPPALALWLAWPSPMFERERQHVEMADPAASRHI